MSGASPSLPPAGPVPARARRGLSKRTVLLTTVGACLVLLAAGARTWVQGRVGDAVLSGSTVAVTGRQAASGVVAAALVALAAVVAALTGGRLARRFGAAALTGSGLLAAALTVPVLTDPRRVLAEQALQRTGRTGGDAAVLTVTGGITPWVPSALVAALALVAAGLGALLSAGAWDGLAGRYDSPAAAPARESSWDRLTRGEDPT